jgi:hypothetical protein
MPLEGCLWKAAKASAVPFLILLEMVLCPQLSFLLFALGGKVTLPAWAKVNMPTPKLT